MTITSELTSMPAPAAPLDLSPPSRATAVSRSDIRAITSVEVNGETHLLGEHRDFRRNQALSAFLPEHGRFSPAWVRLRNGERLEVHQHPTKSMVMVCRGSVRFIGDDERQLTEGDTVCIPAGARHGFATAPGEEFHGLSVQFEGAGLYEDETAPRVRYADAGSAAGAGAERGSFAELQRLGAERLRRYAERHPLFRPFDDGRIANDPRMRERFLSALYVWSVYFQRMLYARQSVCTDPVLRELYADHLREEFGHDVLLRERHGVTETVYDPALEAAGNWFLMQMHGADEAAKIVIVHLVVESSCQVFGERTAPAFADRTADTTSYFELHAEVDEDHSELGMDHLRGLAPEQFPALMRVCNQAWDQLELAHERIAAYLLG